VAGSWAKALRERGKYFCKSFTFSLGKLHLTLGDTSAQGCYRDAVAALPRRHPLHEQACLGALVRGLNDLLLASADRVLHARQFC